MAKLPKIEGCLTALVTPFKAGRVDFDALAKLVDWQIENGVDGIVSVGTTGESATLDVEEHVAVIAATVKAARGRVPVVAGAGGNATSEALALTKASRRRAPTRCSTSRHTTIGRTRKACTATSRRSRV